MKRIIVGISAADGVSIGVRLLERLREISDLETHLVVSRNSDVNLRMELGTEREKILALADRSYEPENMAAAISSGSFPTDGMIVAPCSMKSLAAISNGYSGTLLARAADVCLKERRRLVLIPREAPLSLIHLRNMERVAEAGGVILPSVLTFYSGGRTIEEQIDCLLGKALLQFGIMLPGYRAWEGK
ncbi:MAG: aromatic acid decarboxylase [Clostridia bacterium]|nr:MAG: aromatic acid decarboxylase [Clostridia bacterium]